MAKSLTVQFTDGSTHIYDNVPDDVTQEQANARAGQDFADKTVGVPSQAPAQASPTPTGNEPSMLGQVVGAGQAAVSAANDFLGSPLGHLGEAWLAKKALLDRYLQARSMMGAGTPPAAPTAAPTAAPVARAPIPTGGNVIQFPGAAPAQAVQAAEQPGILSRAAQMYRTYAPVVGENLATAGRAMAPAMEAGARLASRAAGPLSLMAYSGGLNQGEDEAMRKIHQQQDALRLQQNKTNPNAINSGFTKQLTRYQGQ